MVKPLPSSLWTGSKNTQKSWVRTWHPNLLEKHLNNSWKACLQIQKNTPLEKYTIHLLQWYWIFSKTTSSSPCPAIFWLANLRYFQHLWLNRFDVPNIAKVWSWTVLSKVRPLVLLWSEWHGFPMTNFSHFFREGNFEVSTWGNGPFSFQLQ